MELAIGLYNILESYATVRADYQPDWVASDFALSVWLLPSPACNGYVIAKTSESDPLSTYYSLKVTADSGGLLVSATLSLMDQETMVCIRL